MSDAVMIDIEGFGSPPDGAIVSIGAAAFDYAGAINGTYYVNCKASGRRIEESTVRWWLQQGEEARKALADPAPVPLKEALNGLQQFLQKRKVKHIWANGVSYDLVMLRDAYAQVRPDSQFVPWSYKQEMCMRPLRVLGAAVGLDYSTFKGEREGTYHHALADALHQVEYVCRVWQRCVKGEE